MADEAAAPTPADDAELLAHHVAGSPHAFAELLRRYRGQVLGYLVRCGVPPATRDDLAQEIFLKVHRGAPRYEPRRPVRTWLFTIVANTVRSFFRSRRAVHELHAGVVAPSPDANALELMEGGELQAFLGEQLERLPLEQREVIALTCTTGLSDAETSAILGLPTATVKTHRRRARLRLARALARRRARARREAEGQGDTRLR